MPVDGRNMYRKQKSIIFLLLGLLIIVNFKSVRLVSDVRDYAKVINYVGLVRGTSQRVVKLETNGIKSDQLIAYVDGILNELITGEGSYGLVKADDEAYQTLLASLYRQWGLVKSGVQEARNGYGDQDVLDSSEELFLLADSTVGAIESYSRQKSAEAGMLVLCTLVFCGAAFGAAVYYYVRKSFRLQKEKEALEDLTGRDELTGLYTLDRFCAEAGQRISQLQDGRYAIFYIDFENFKYINDVFGYDFGDELLKEYSRLIVESLKTGELAGRSMADRFLIFRCYEDKKELLAIQQAVDSALLNCDLIVSSKHMLTIACGICCAEDLMETPEAVMMVNRANFAQKTVKNDPGNHYAFYNEQMRRRLFTEISIRDRMKEALAQDEFVMYLQPKVGPRDRLIKSAEALVRWQTPGQGLIQPGVFIPVLEKNHFISQVDQHIFRKVCSWLHMRLTAGLPVVPISVNVSKTQFFNPDFVSTYVSIKNEYHLPDWLVEIEFTETVAFSNREFIIEIVTALHQNGFLCSLDDFGSGYSSLGMLKDLPFDVLKLDGTFFRVSVNVQRERTIVESIIRMVKALNIITVAEGVEHEEQVSFLKDIGCDLIQGFVFYKPMPLEDFERVLASQQALQEKIMRT